MDKTLGIGDKMTDKYTNGLRRLYIAAGIAGGSFASWVLSEIVTTVPLTLYFVYVCLGIFVAVALIDDWRLR